MLISGTHFNYYQVCHRKLWLFANGINMEQNSDLVYAGKLIHEESYPQRSERYEEIEIDGIKVDYYGAPTPIKNLATISTPEPRQIKITPFDPTVLAEMNKAILAANLGVTPQMDGKVLRITIPELNEERRKEIVKMAKRQAEDQKIAMRNVRRDANDALKKLEKDGKISEDDLKVGLDKVQKATDDGIAKIDAELKAKEAEVMAV